MGSRFCLDMPGCCLAKQNHLFSPSLYMGRPSYSRFLPLTKTLPSPSPRLGNAAAITNQRKALFLHPPSVPKEAANVKTLVEQASQTYLNQFAFTFSLSSKLLNKSDPECDERCRLHCPTDEQRHPSPPPFVDDPRDKSCRPKRETIIGDKIESHC